MVFQKTKKPLRINLSPESSRNKFFLKRPRLKHRLKLYSDPAVNLLKAHKVRTYKEHTLYKRHEVKKKLIIYFILLALTLILAGKGFSYDSGFFAYYFYGVIVTVVLLGSFYYAIFVYEDPAVIAEDLEKNDLARGRKPPQPLVSCMVAVYNEKDAIDLCLKSLLAQTYENKEIIIVDDGSLDGTDKILNHYAEKYGLKVIRQKNAGKKRALGRAMREARGSLFAFTDSDSFWAGDALEKMVRIMNYFPDVGGVSGHFRLKNSDTNFLTRAQDAWVEGQFAIRKAFESCYGAVTCISGPLAVFRREAIYNFIPAWENDEFLGSEFMFATDRTLTGFLLGNKYIAKKLKAKYADDECVKSVDYPEKDWQAVYSKSARSWTVLPASFKGLIKQHIRWKKSFIRNTFFTGGFYWHKPLIPSLVYYLHIVFVLVGPLIAFRHLVYLPWRGDLLSIFLYIGGIALIGFIFGLFFRLENKSSRLWFYRPVMSLLSTLVLSWVVFYSALTIKKMVWTRSYENKN